MPQVKIRIESTSDEKEAKNEAEATSIGTEKIATASLFAHQAVNTAKQIVSYQISNVGVKTGNYVLQEQINQVVDIISDVSTVGLGFAAGGWIGGIVAIAGVSTKQMFKEMSYVESLKHENIQTEYLRRRSGNTTTSGSRGTEN